MSIVEIVKTDQNNNKIPQILQTKCAKVGQVDDSVAEIIKNLLDTIKNSSIPAAGLSAPQIGVNRRICIIRKFKPNPNNPEEDLATDIVLINPEITGKSKSTDIAWEGCLSIPHLYGRVQRAEKVNVIALNENGDKIKIKASGYLARVIQHEVDHLDGILFTQKVIGKLITEEELDRRIEQRTNEGGVSF